jgi:selenocysteine lyase/cysteine desulfurase
MTIKTGAARKLFPATRRLTYFFNGGICLCSTPVQRAISEFLVQAQNGFSAENWKKWNENATESYKLVADFIGASSDEIVAVPNTSVGMGVIAHIIEPKPGQNIVLDDLEWNTIYPFTIREKAGVDIRKVRSIDGYVPMETMESLVDDKTSAVVVSAVSCWNGYRYDLKRLSDIAHSHGAYLVVDAAQQAGAVRLEAQKHGVDFLATCGTKWLLAPPGSGFLFVRKELAERFDPPLPGWMGTTDPFEADVWQPQFAKTPQRFESGLRSFMVLAATRASLQLIKKLGLDNIEHEILKRSGYLIEKLQAMGVKICTPIEKEHRAGLVTFLLKNHEALYRELSKNSIITYQHPQNVVTSLGWTSGGLRVDPTFFNTIDELDKLLGYVKKHI